jgi:hypothetical protein
MIANSEQFQIALKQLASFKGMLEATQSHLQETQPSIIPLISESYERRIQEIQSEICDFLLATESRADTQVADKGEITQNL